MKSEKQPECQHVEPLLGMLSGADHKGKRKFRKPEEKGVCPRCDSMPAVVEVVHQRSVRHFASFMSNVSHIHFKRTTGEDVMALTAAVV